jgi:hypothetical protein
MNLNTHVITKEFYNSRRIPVVDLNDLSKRKDDSWINSKNISTFIIEVSGAEEIEATVLSCINMTNISGERLEVSQRPYTPISLIDLSTLEVVHTITKNGLYQMGSSGLPEVRLNITKLSGNVVIIGAGSDD